MYIRFDLLEPDTVDPWLLEDLVQEWVQKHGVKFAKKIIWNHRKREYRVSFLEPQVYTMFVLTWPDWAPGFQIIEP